MVVERPPSAAAGCRCASASSMSAPAATSIRAASRRPSRAAYSSGVMPPLASARRPRSGRPPRLMPTPSEPQPVPLHGGTNFGVGPLRVCALTAAPALDQEIDRRRMVLAHRDHQRGLLELGIAGVDARRRGSRSSAQRGRPCRCGRPSSTASRRVASPILGSAPASSSRWIISALPFRQAR